MIIRCIDFETTGIPTEADKHAIVEIGWCDLGTSAPRNLLCNPGRTIPPEAKAVHHITDEMVKYATGDVSVLDGADIYVAHNADYERQFYRTDKPFICTYKVALRYWPEAPSHGLQFLRYYLDLDVSPALVEPPHRAAPDAYLCSVLMAQIMSREGASLDEMTRWSSGPALLPRITFGKHKGSRWEDVPSDYLEWLAFKSDMDRDIKANAKHHLSKRGR